jgi:hypothetical protein
MSQKRKREAAALINRMAAMAGAAPERGAEVGAAVIFPDFLSAEIAFRWFRSNA